MAKFSVKKALAIAGALTVLGAGVFFGIDAASDDFNVVFYPDPIVNPIPTPDPDPTPIPDPDPQPGLIQLAAPEMAYNQEDNILTWEEVENASGYLLNVNGVEETTTQTQAVLDIGQNEQYKISLKALGDGEKYSDSEMATLSGVRQNLDQMYYEQIEDNIYSFFDTYNIRNSIGTEEQIEDDYILDGIDFDRVKGNKLIGIGIILIGAYLLLNNVLYGIATDTGLDFLADFIRMVRNYFPSIIVSLITIGIGTKMISSK